MRVRAYPITATLTNITLGAEQAFDSPEFGDMGGHASDGRRAFDQQAPMDGLVMTIMDRDRQRAGWIEINSFCDTFMHYLKLALAGIGAGSHRRRGRRRPNPAHRALHPIIEIAAAVIVILILAAWAPADLIIEGVRSATWTASPARSFRMPPVTQFISQQGIKVIGSREVPDAVQGAPRIPQRRGGQPLRDRPALQPRSSAKSACCALRIRWPDRRTGPVQVAGTPGQGTRNKPTAGTRKSAGAKPTGTAARPICARFRESETAA